MTMVPATPTHTLKTHTAFDAKAQELLDYDTGQMLDTCQIDAGQLEAIAYDCLADGDHEAKLVATFHEIHKIDETVPGEQEMITSTLKYFSLHLAVQDDAGELQFHLDDLTLVASLTYEDGEPVGELSATHEPPLLAAAGESPPKAMVEGGIAEFRLRITVLSSLCNKRSFCVRVAALERPELAVMTAPVKTITKLRRGPRDTAERRPTTLTPTSALVERRAPPNGMSLAPESPATGTCGAKRGLDVLGDQLGFVQGAAKCGAWATDGCFGGGETVDQHTLDELWDQVATNGAKLLELQSQQRRLFKELRALKADESACTSTCASTCADAAAP